MKTWSPKVTDDGWWPKLRPSGTHVLYGDWQATHLGDLRLTPGQPGAETRIVSPNGARVYSLGWLDDDTFLIVTENPNAVYQVALVDVQPVNGAFTIPASCQLNVQPMIPVNWGNARAGSWAIGQSDGTPRTVKNGTAFRPDVPNQYGVSVAGEHLVTLDKDVAMLHFKGDQLLRKLPPDLFVVNEFGDIIAGYYGEVFCCPFDGKRTNITIAPWRTEGVGAPLVRIGNDLWAWTFTEIGTEQLALGRRIVKSADGTYASEPDPIVIHNFVGASNASDVIVVGNEFVLASNNPTGRMEVRWVPIDAPREKLAAAPTPVVTPLAPDVSSKLVAGAWGTTAETPGNLSIGPNPTKAIICTIEELGQVDLSRVMGLWVNDGSSYTLTQRIAQCQPYADELKVPLVVYVDDRDYRKRLPAILAAVGSTPWIAQPQCYIDCRGKEGESLDAFAAEVAAQVAGLPVPWIGAVRCTTPSINGVVVIPVDRVIAAMNRLVPIVADANCLGWALFAWKRGDGVTGIPALLPAAQAWLTGTPTLQPDQAREWAANLFTPVEIPMNVPDHSDTVRDLFATDAFNLSTHTGCGIFTDACARALHARDPRWGNLKKNPGQNQYPEVSGHAVDAVLYLSDTPGQSTAVDLIRAVPDDDETLPGEQPAVSWGVDKPRYNPQDWRDPGPQPVSTVQRPALPFLGGMTGFDWGTHLDQAWVALHTEYKLPVLRIVPQSVYRTPRTPAEGIAQLDAALSALPPEIKALVVINCDTKDYDMDRDAVRANTSAINAVMVKHMADVAAASLSNENSNHNEQPFMTDPFFLLELDGLVDARIPLSWGCMFGRDVSPVAAGGSWIAHHSDRGLSPDENGQIMATAQQRFGKPVVDQEPLGAAEPGTPGQRYFDPEYARALGKAAKQYGLGGLIYHTQAGLRANVAEFGTVHRAGAVALVEGLGGSVVVTPPPPPPTDDLTALGDESRASAIKIAYTTLLERDPDPVGVSIYTERLKSGWTVQQMEDDIKASAEYKAKHGG